MNKKILGLDLGTNSIGWALVENDFENKKGKILGTGSRIIPMSQEILGKFESGNSHSQTAERTQKRGTRRLYQRSNLRRERLHRVLNIIDFLPEHYAAAIDFEKRFGQFKKEVKLNYKKNEQGKYEFLFQNSFKEMLEAFKQKHSKIKNVPYDWCIYYLRKKALTKKISKEELAWILLQFNTKRGYYQERDEKEEKDNKKKTFEELKVSQVKDSGETLKGKKDKLYDVFFETENGDTWKYDKQTTKPENWIDQTKKFIVTHSKSKDGTIKRSFGKAKEDDWIVVKQKTEGDIEKFGGTVGEYIYENLLKNPTRKIKGALVQHIGRETYEEELRKILKTQIEHHPELKNRDLYQKCIDELYKHNESHKRNIKDKGFDYLFLKDIIFYHRPLKSKKSTIGECQYEKENYERTDKEGNKFRKGLKVTSKSNPLFIEFRLWQFLHNLKIYEIDGVKDKEITITDDEKVKLFDFLNDKKEVKQSDVIKYFEKEKGLEKVKKGAEDKYKWNYISYTDDKKKTEKTYPVNPTRNQFLAKCKKANIESNFLNKKTEQHLWHIFYSVNDKIELKKALGTFAKNNNLREEDRSKFVEEFVKISKYPSQYGAYSEKAIRKLLPLMRMGKYWKKDDVEGLKIEDRIKNIKDRLEHIDYDKEKIEGVKDDDIPKQVLKSFIPLQNGSFLSGLNTYQACYLVYGRHSEVAEIKKWEHPEDINTYLKKFKQHSLRNPIVEQIVLETLRTVRDIWKYFKKEDENFKFDEIHIELGRDMKNSAEQRKKIMESQNKNETTNKRVKELLKELKETYPNEDIRPYSEPQQEKLKLYENGISYNPNVSYKNISEDEVKKIVKNNNPTKAEIKKYRLWLEQGYVSPYTGKIIPLSKLFSKDYEVEHIIPQSKYFDNSFNNKIICETTVNKDKKDVLALEWLEKAKGKEIPLGENKKVTLLTKEEYKNHCEQYFKKNKAKLKNLLAEEIPDGFINRQLNDTRYIAKLIKGLLGNIVREKNEKEATPKKLIPMVGQITSKLKQDWGLNDKWNEIIAPRFKRMNELTNSKDFGYEDNKDGKKFFRTQIPDTLPQIKGGFKRIDHRHHALDAIVIACCTRKHINYLNSLNAEKENDGLKHKLLIKNKEGDYTKNFKDPWDNFTVEAKKKLEKVIISFKQNTRILNKTNNKYQKWKEQKDGSYKKEFVSQKGKKGKNWAIRKPLHEESVFGKVYVKKVKEGSLNSYLEKPKIDEVENKKLMSFKSKPYALIVDKNIRKQIKNLHEKFDSDIKKIKAHLKKEPIKIEGKAISKIKVYEWTKKAVAMRRDVVGLKKADVEKITDTAIKKILENHLKKYKNEGQKQQYEKAFSEEGVQELNKNIKELNGGKFHHPIKKVRVYQDSDKFPIDKEHGNANKHTQYVKTAKGTNLFFAIYEKDGKRKYETIPLNEVIEHQKQTADLPKDERTEIPIKKEKGKFLFSLSPNDLVYVPTEKERENSNLVDFDNPKEQVKRLFIVNDFYDKKCLFCPVHHSVSIDPKEVDLIVKNEKLQGSYPNKTANFKNENGEIKKIIDICWKLKIDRLGNIIKLIKNQDDA